MASAIEGAPASKKLIWTGRILSGITVAFLLFDGIIKLMLIQPVVDSFAELGYPVSQAFGIGVLGIVCAVLYALPRTAILGAILLTGMLGGAIATHVRVGDPIFSHVLFGVYLGLIAWGGLYLRDARLRSMIPLRA
jgi:hypothetical protein